MKKYLLLMIGICLVVIHYFIENIFNIYNVYIDSYLDDCLAIPIILGITFFIETEILKKPNNYIHNKAQIIFTVLTLSILFEWILPKHSSLYVADGFDLLCYCFGAIIYYYASIILFKNKNLKYV